LEVVAKAIFPLILTLDRLCAWLQRWLFSQEFWTWY